MSLLLLIWILLSTLKKTLNSSGGSFKGKTILEIGSGFSPIGPYLFSNELDTSDVLTFDIGEHYTAKSIELLNRKFNVNTTNGTLPKNVRYFPKSTIKDVSNISEVDIVYSRNVLEHIPEPQLFELHYHMKKELPPGALVLHQISPSDYRSFTDENIGLLDFLQYNSAEWRKRVTRFDYHNRLRLPQFLNIFKSVGFNILNLKYSKTEDYKFLPKVISKEFTRFTKEELVAGNIRIVMQNIN